jgi:hypothetical protein
LPLAYLLVLAEIISSTLKMEAICSFETSVATQQTTRRQIPEDNTLHNHGCENLKSYIVYQVVAKVSGEDIVYIFRVTSILKMEAGHTLTLHRVIYQNTTT